MDAKGIDVTHMTSAQREQVVSVLAAKNATIEALRAELHAAIHQAQEWRAKLTEREAEIEQLEDDLCDKNNTYHNAWQDARIENDRLKEQRDALALQVAEWEGKYAIVTEQKRQDLTINDNLAATAIAEKFGMVPYRLADRAGHPPYKAALMAIRAEREVIAAWLRGRAHADRLQIALGAVFAPRHMCEVAEELATAIASGAYRETGNE